MILREFKRPPCTLYCPYCRRYYHSARMKDHEHTSLKYTHIDYNGLRWRFDEGRPVSELADAVMGDLGYLQLPKRPIKPRAKRKGH